MPFHWARSKKVSALNQMINMDIEGLFSPLTTYLQVFGLYVPGDRKGCKRSFQILYCIFLQSVTWFNVYPFVYIFQLDVSLSGSLMTNLSYFLSTFGVAYLSAAFSVASSRHMSEVFEKCHFYQNKFGFQQNFRKGRLTLRVMCIVVGLLTICQLIAAYGNFYTYDDSSLRRFGLPFIDLDDAGKGLGVFMLSLMGAVFWNSECLPIVFFYGMYQLLRNEFDSLTESVRRMTTDGKVEGEIERMRQQHQQLVEIVGMSDTIISHFLFILYAVQIPIVCFILFGLIRGSLASEEFFVTLFLSIWGIGACFLTTITAARLCSKAHSCLDNLLKADLTNLPAKSLHVMSIFVSRLTGSPVGFTVYGLFTVDSSTILTIMGTLLTYAIVVLQLKPEDTGFSHSWTNSTL